jgi:hypothetical protein
MGGDMRITCAVCLLHGEKNWCSATWLPYEKALQLDHLHILYNYHLRGGYLGSCAFAHLFWLSAFPTDALKVMMLKEVVNQPLPLIEFISDAVNYAEKHYDQKSTSCT